MKLNHQVIKEKEKKHSIYAYGSPTKASLLLKLSFKDVFFEDMLNILVFVFNIS